MAQCSPPKYAPADVESLFLSELCHEIDGVLCINIFLMKGVSFVAKLQ